MMRLYRTDYESVLAVINCLIVTLFNCKQCHFGVEFISISPIL